MFQPRVAQVNVRQSQPPQFGQTLQVLEVGLRNVAEVQPDPLRFRQLRQRRQADAGRLTAKEMDLDDGLARPLRVDFHAAFHLLNRRNRLCLLGTLVVLCAPRACQEQH
jgi:hypothetical protein